MGRARRLDEVLLPFGAPRVGRLVDRFGTPRLIAAGALAFVAGYALFLRVDASPYVLGFLPTMLRTGLAVVVGVAVLGLLVALAGVASPRREGGARGGVTTRARGGPGSGRCPVPPRSARSRP